MAREEGGNVPPQLPLVQKPHQGSSDILSPSAIKHFEGLLDRIGIWVVFTRSDHRFRCRDCFNPITNDSPPGCGTCFGTGYKTTLERWKVYYTNRISRATVLEMPLTTAGFSPEHTVYLFTRADMAPLLNDYAYIVEWDRFRNDIDIFAGRPKRIVQALRVLYSEPFFIGQQIYLLNHCGLVPEVIQAVEPILLRTDIPNTLPT